MKSDILACISANKSDGISLKKLKKECMGDDMTSLSEHAEAKKKFKKAFDFLVSNEVIMEDANGKVVLFDANAAVGEKEEKKAKKEKKDKKDKKEKRARAESDMSNSNSNSNNNNNSSDNADETQPAGYEEEQLAKKPKWEKGPAKEGKKDKKNKEASKFSGGGKDEYGEEKEKVPLIESGQVGDRYELSSNGEQAWRQGTLPQEYLETNPDGITRLFCGNLKLDVTEEALMELMPGITYIRWQKDKVTKAFYGSTFLELKDPRAAAQAVAMDGNKFMGRPLKIYYCPPRPGVTWPPVAGTAGNSAYKEAAGGNYADAYKRDSNGLDPTNIGRGYSQRAKTSRPPGCKKLYAGNLAYTIDDDVMVIFFKDCGEMVGLRWLTKKDTGEFRGCGFVEFSSPQEAEAAMLLDGEELLGRPIRLDWTA
jgi:nucleolin